MWRDVMYHHELWGRETVFACRIPSVNLKTHKIERLYTFEDRLQMCDGNCRVLLGGFRPAACNACSSFRGRRFSGLSREDMQSERWLSGYFGF